MNEQVLKEAKENINQFFTEEHIKLIQKGITKAIKNIDFDSIVQDFIEGEFEYAQDRCEVVNNINTLITSVIRQHLVKSGLLKEEGENNQSI